MEDANNLQARVQAATQSLAGRKEHQQEMRGTLDGLEAENTRLGKENDRFSGEIDGIRQEGERLAAEAEQLRGENKRLIADNSRFRGEIERFEADNETLRVDRDQLNELLESLVDAVEGNESFDEVEREPDVERQVQTAEVVEMAAVVADGTTGMAIVQDAFDPGTLEVVSAMRDKYYADDAEDIPNENARRLMDRIKERIEAQRG
jgi:chromosome segregation ATPase